MSDRTLSRLAWVVAAAGLVVLALAMVFIVLRIPAGPLPNEPTWYGDLILTASLSVSLVVGGFVASSLPRNPYGWLLLAFGWGNGALLSFGENYGIYSLLVAPETLPFTSQAFILAAIGFSLWFATIPLLFLLFPTGHLPSRRWWPVAALVVLAFLVMVTLLWRSPSAVLLPVASPYHQVDRLGTIADNAVSTAVTFLIFATLICAVSVVVRGIRARGIERQQFKWLGLASILIVLAIFFNTELVPLLPGLLDPLLEAAAFAGVPLAVGIAVTRYRLWDIELVIRKTVQYTLITIALAVVYVVLVVSLQGLFSRLLNEESPAAVVLSTLAIAALFTPVRRWVQGAVDRRFYRRKYDAEQVLARFAATARDETNLERLTAELVRVIEETMGPEHVTVWLKPVAGARSERARPGPPAAADPRAPG
jgi:hypothetical protein